MGYSKLSKNPFILYNLVCTKILGFCKLTVKIHIGILRKPQNLKSNHPFWILQTRFPATIWNWSRSVCLIIVYTNLLTSFVIIFWSRNNSKVGMNYSGWCDLKKNLTFSEYMNLMSYDPFFVFGHFWQRSYKNTKILRNLRSHFARQDGQDKKTDRKSCN